jgi:hypothetical protein
MPGVRGLCDEAEAEAEGKTVTRLSNVDDLNTFARMI